MLKTSLENIMSEDVVTINDGATIGQAAHILLRFRINGILVVKKTDKNAVVGIITTTDLLRFLDDAMSLQGNRVEALDRIGKTPLVALANKNVKRIQKDTKIERVVSIMHKQNIHTLPVYNGNKLVGVVGKHDILNLVFSQ